MPPEWLAGELITMAFCWRLVRRDGVALGFASHDRDLLRGDFLYRAAPGMTPSAVSQGEGLDVATLDVAGALTSDAIREADLLAGRWDGARLTLWAVDWADPTADPLLLARGELGDISVSDAGFSAELRGAAALLERPVVEATSPECRAELGDARCGVDMAARRVLTRVVTVSDDVTLTVEATEPLANAYGYGWLRFVDGANGGIMVAVLRSAGNALVLREAAPFDVEPGVRVELVEGCDRLLDTCRIRFANAANFRGEPHLPGIDLLTRYPGA